MKTRSGLFASTGAFVAALLSSACCWLPFFAIGLGASSSGFAAFFEPWRQPLLLVTVALLGFGFYFVYRKPRCGPDGACAVPSRGRRRFNRAMLWCTTVLVIAAALFPEYVPVSASGVVEATPSQMTVRYQVDGMTCAGCEGHARDALSAIPGVVSAAVSYKESRAVVVWDGTRNDEAVADAIAVFGYRANPIR